MIWNESYDTFIANTPNVKTGLKRSKFAMKNNLVKADTTRFATSECDGGRRVIAKKSFKAFNDGSNDFFKVAIITGNVCIKGSIKPYVGQCEGKKVVSIGVGYADNFVNNGFPLAYELIAKRLVKNGEFVERLIHGFALPFDKFLTREVVASIDFQRNKFYLQFQPVTKFKEITLMN